MHLRGMRAGLAQNLRLFLCMDLGIMRGVLLVGFAAGKLGCWWAGLLVGFWQACRQYYDSDSIPLSYFCIRLYYIIYIYLYMSVVA